MSIIYCYSKAEEGGADSRQCGINDDDEIWYRQAVIKMFNYIYSIIISFCSFINFVIAWAFTARIDCRLVYTYANHILYEIITYLY